jgi:DNA polymerase III delta subunit
MVIFLYGPDTYRLKKYKDYVLEEYHRKHSSGVNLFSFDFSDLNTGSSLEDSIRSSSFFNEHKLVICKNLSLFLLWNL